MARTEKRGKRDRPQRPTAGTPAGPVLDPEEAIEEADRKGEIKKHRPDKAHIRRVRDEEPE